LQDYLRFSGNLVTAVLVKLISLSDWRQTCVLQKAPLSLQLTSLLQSSLSWMPSAGQMKPAHLHDAVVL